MKATVRTNEFGPMGAAVLSAVSTQQNHTIVKADLLISHEATAPFAVYGASAFALDWQGDNISLLVNTQQPCDTRILSLSAGGLTELQVDGHQICQAAVSAQGHLALALTPGATAADAPTLADKLWLLQPGFFTTFTLRQGQLFAHRIGRHHGVKKPDSRPLFMLKITTLKLSALILTSQ